MEIHLHTCDFMLTILLELTLQAKKNTKHTLFTFRWVYIYLIINTSNVSGISIQDIGGVFLVIFLGIGLGIIALLFEYYWYRWSGFAVLEKTKETKHGEVGHNTECFIPATQMSPLTPIEVITPFLTSSDRYRACYVPNGVQKRI